MDRFEIPRIMRTTLLPLAVVALLWLLAVM